MLAFNPKAFSPKYTLMLLFVVFYSLIAHAQISNNDPYNLLFDFTKNTIWRDNGLGAKCKITADSSQVVNGKYPLLIKRSRQQGNWNTLSLSQRIVLPQAVSDTICVRIHSNSGNLTSAYLNVWRYNERDEFIAKDSVNLTHNGWQWYTLSLPEKTTRVMEIEVLVNALNWSLSSISLFDNPDFKQFLALDRMEIKIGSKDISAFAPLPDDKMALPVKLDGAKMVPLTSVVDKPLPMFQGKKIVALGESIHSNESINQTVFDMIKSQILHQNCKLVVYEMPYTMGLLYNYYVSEQNVTPLFKKIIQASFRPELSVKLRDFLEWLRAYNKDKSRKVLFLGMDDSFSEEFSSAFDVVDASVKDPTQRVKLADLYYYLARKHYRNAEQESVEQQDILLKVLGKQTFDLYKLVIHLSGMYNDMSPKKVISHEFDNHRRLTRDSTMFQLCKTYISWLKADETTCIYAHQLHIGKNNSLNPLLPLGYYMNNEYGADYFPVSLLVGGGQSTMFWDGAMLNMNANKVYATYALSSPPSNSIEMAAGNLSDKPFYYPYDSTNYDFCMSRILGNSIGIQQIEHQFSVISPKSYTDGFIYIPIGTPYSVLLNAKKSPEDARLAGDRYGKVISTKKTTK